MLTPSRGCPQGRPRDARQRFVFPTAGRQPHGKRARIAAPWDGARGRRCRIYLRRRTIGGAQVLCPPAKHESAATYGYPTDRQAGPQRARVRTVSMREPRSPVLTAKPPRLSNVRAALQPERLVVDAIQGADVLQLVAGRHVATFRAPDLAVHLDGCEAGKPTATGFGSSLGGTERHDRQVRPRRGGARPSRWHPRRDCWAGWGRLDRSAATRPPRCTGHRDDRRRRCRRIEPQPRRRSPPLRPESAPRIGNESAGAGPRSVCAPMAAVRSAAIWEKARSLRAKRSATACLVVLCS